MAETPDERQQRAITKAMSKKYQVVIVGHDGRVHYRGSNKAMSDAAMLNWASNLNGAFVTRLYPSRKGWLIIDARRAQAVSSGGNFTRWINAPRSTKPIPTMEAAIMTCLHLNAGQRAAL